MYSGGRIPQAEGMEDTTPQPPESEPSTPGSSSPRGAHPADGAGTGPDTPTATDAATAPPEERLHRSRRNRMVAGVASGLADYFDVDPTLVRIGFVVLTLMGGLAVPLYVAGWLLIPEEGAELSMAEDLLARESVF
jgi:phage shock protein PspC (stress-responsive transcriptional regulator)